ncbi:MAG: hypothetical protein A3E78_03970 [Alphaproteobacteria bacterium RIFCSPHIGHO2_12_FULL_63_12]|nr:MAG: hypothetical protein A3E78_03970 [Alphaproteobacteria bacterium RIFCSPHIGHO2_12_FULL_63_12]
MIVFRIAVSIFALLLIGFGLVVTISPIPFGFIIVAIGFLLFVAVSPGEVRWLRRRWRWFDKMMHRLEKRLPEWIAKRLRVSDYDHAEDEDEPPAPKRSRRRG